MGMGLQTNLGSRTRGQNSAVNQNIDRLRMDARELYQSDDYVKRLVGLYQNNVIGPNGFMLQNKSGDPNINKAVEFHWKQWQRHCDASGRLNFRDTLNLLAKTFITDGEFFVYHRKNPLHPYGYDLQLIETDALDTTYNVAVGDRIVRAGIEYGDFHKPVAYHFKTRNPYDAQEKFLSEQAARIPIAAEHITHFYKPEIINQNRGIPLLTTPANRIKLLQEYEDYTLETAKLGASLSGVIERDPQAPGLTTGENPEDGPIEIEVKPGHVETLPAGHVYKSVTANYPNSQMPDYVKEILRSVASGWNISYFQLSGDLESVNYSTGRIGLLGERDGWLSQQGFWIDNFIIEVFQRWLEMALFMDALGLGSIGFEKVNHPSFTGRRWEWMDPLKAAAGMEKLIALNVATVSQFVRDQGKDPEEVFLERAAELKRFAELGISAESANSALTDLVLQEHLKNG